MLDTKTLEQVAALDALADENRAAVALLGSRIAALQSRMNSLQNAARQITRPGNDSAGPQLLTDAAGELQLLLQLVSEEIPESAAALQSLLQTAAPMVQTILAAVPQPE